MNRKIFLLISNIALLLPAPHVVAATGGLSVSGTTTTTNLTISSLDCTANANGGALTASASGVVSCSDDDNTVVAPLIVNGSFSGSIISGLNSGSGYGVLGLRGSFELGNRGYLGHSDYGVYGDGAIGTAIGVYGRNLFSGNFGYLGGSVHGVHGESGTGIGGYFTSATGYGLIVGGGNVGIGTLNPSEKLTVEGNIFVNGTSGFDAAGEDASVQFGHPAHNIRGVHGTGVVISAYSAPDALTVREITGNVGIGTLNPREKLDVEGNIFVNGTAGFDAAGEDAIVQFGNPAYSIRGEYGTGVVISAYSAPDALTVSEITGNVGIGTTSPSEKLTVAGTIESTIGGIKFPDGSVQTTGATYANVAVVAQVGGDYTNPLTAMNNADSGDNWCYARGVHNTCLLKIMPGYYNIGDNVLYMLSYLDIEGSGENTTIISSTHSSSSSDVTSATVSGANNAEIRFITIENRGGDIYAIAIYNFNASPDITNVTATATGSGDVVSIGVYNNSSSPAMTNVTATASLGKVCVGVENYYFSSPVMTNVTATATAGSSINRAVLNYVYAFPSMINVTATASGGSEATGVRNDSNSGSIIRNSSIRGTQYSIYNYYLNAEVKVGVTMLDGPVSGTDFTCVGAYDKDFAALDSACK